MKMKKNKKRILIQQKKSRKNKMLNKLPKKILLKLENIIIKIKAMILGKWIFK